MIDIKQALNLGIIQLTPSSTTARIDAEVLLTSALGASRTFLYAHPEKQLTPAQHLAYTQLIDKRCTGFPIAYLTGQREFWSLPLQVSKDTLIPRPETELLVELALQAFKNTTEAHVLELGTGSGAIALALASERPDWHILAIDKSQAALKIAKTNAASLGHSNVVFLASDWFTSMPNSLVNMIISNPPYIAENDAHLNEGDVRFEPQEALVSGHDGLNALKHIIQQGFDYLLPGGLLIVEHGFDQKEAVTLLFRERGYINVTCWQDVQGQDRVSAGWRGL